MKTRHVVLLFLSLLLITAALMGIFWNYVYNQLVVPVEYVLWLSSLILRSISQTVYWILVFLVSSIILLRNIGKPGRVERITPQQHTRVERGRLHYWATKINVDLESQFKSKDLSNALKTLLVTVRAHKHYLTIAEAREEYEKDEINLPIFIREITKRLENIQQDEHPRLTTRIARILQALGFQQNMKSGITLEDLQLESMIQYLEKELEIQTHDHK